MARTLQLALHGRPLGRVYERVDHRGPAYDLEFDAAWLDQLERPVATLAATNWRLDRIRPFVGRLPAFLTNLLPERDGALRRRIARAAGLPENDDLALLDFVGGDLSGALSASFVEGGGPPPRRRAAPHDGHAHNVSDESERLRWSLGGIQAKFSVDRTHRLSLPLRGRGGRWILKLPEPSRPTLARAELATLEWARAVGFDVPEAVIVDPREVEGLPSDAAEGIPEALLVRRFDRLDDYTPVHMEELASVMGVQPENKYAEPGATPRGSSLLEVGSFVRRFAGPSGLRTFLERVVFDALAGNGDAHLKNWAFRFPDGRQAELAPVYDVCPTVLFDYPPQHALPFMGEHAFSAMTEDGIRRFARKLGEPPDELVGGVEALVKRALDTLEGAMATAAFPGTRPLREHVRSLRLFRQFAG